MRSGEDNVGRAPLSVGARLSVRAPLPVCASVRVPAVVVRRATTGQALFLLLLAERVVDLVAGAFLVAGFFAALRAVAFAGASPFLSRLFFSSAMKSTTLVVASCVGVSSSATSVVAPFCFMRFLIAALRRSLNSSL